MVKGFLFIDKPSGPTSYDVIRRLKPLVGKTKIGHAGTLDPLASGLLIVGIGRDATKKLDMFKNLRKTYEVKALVGKSYDAQDVTGKLISEKIITHVNESNIKEVLQSFIGKSKQLPPMFSAVKYKGKPLYKFARKGVTISRKQRKILIYSINAIHYKKPYVTFVVICSSGTYIRTLVHDFGEKLGTGAAVAELRRLSIGEFDIKQALKSDNITTSLIKKHLHLLKSIDIMGGIYWG